jgi:hypothetical protein
MATTAFVYFAALCIVFAWPAASSAFVRETVVMGLHLLEDLLRSGRMRLGGLHTVAVSVHHLLHLICRASPAPS